MSEESRLDEIAKNVGDVRERMARIEERVDYLCKHVEPMESRLIERCKTEVKAWGWKSVSTLITAVAAGISGLILNLLK